MERALPPLVRGSSLACRHMHQARIGHSTPQQTRLGPRPHGHVHPQPRAVHDRTAFVHRPTTSPARAKCWTTSAIAPGRVQTDPSLCPPNGNGQRCGREIGATRSATARGWRTLRGDALSGSETPQAWSQWIFSRTNSVWVGVHLRARPSRRKVAVQYGPARTLGDPSAPAAVRVTAVTGRAAKSVSKLPTTASPVSR